MLRIGSVERVHVPLFGSRPVEAKIDTGADSSSIWVTDITETSGKLTFRSVSSRRKPSKKIHSVKDFSQVKIKNSFGVSEFRYRVLLDVQIGKNIYRTWFTLSDRSQNTYPVLLGKKLLDNNFLVDTSKKHVQHLELEVSSGPTKILVIAKQRTREVEAFLENLRATSTEDAVIEYCYLIDLQFIFEDGNEPQIIDTRSGKNLREYSLVYFKSYMGMEEVACTAAYLLRVTSTRCIDTELLNNDLSTTKLGELARLSMHKVAVPKSVVATRKTLSQLDLTKYTYPLVLKAIDGAKGRDNVLVSNEETLKEQLALFDEKRWLVLQQYVPNNGYSRIVVLGGIVRLQVDRSAHVHKNPLKQHLNNPKGGVNASLVAVKAKKTEIQRLATYAARAMKRDVAGVDIIQNKNTKQYYVLEVNYNPEMLSGSFKTEKFDTLSEFLKEHYTPQSAKLKKEGNI